MGTYHWDYADRYNKARGKDAILQPWTVSPAGEYASLIPAGKVVEWFTDNAGKQEALASELQVLKRVGEEDNPVIVLME